MDCSVGGLRVGSASAGVRCRGEGICAVSYQLCGDGFSSYSATKAPLGPLAPLLDHVCLNDVGKSPSGPRSPVVREEAKWSSTPSCRPPWICRFKPFSGQGKALVFFRRSVSLSRPRQEHGLPLIKNSRARALASSQRLSLERRLRRSLNHADVSSELTMRAFPAGSNAMAAEEMAPKISRDFYFSNSSIYIEKV